jgi:hydrogenase expression/formation protein HypC
MCLAVPALIKSVDGQVAEVEIGRVRRSIGLQLTPEARVGDHVLIHAGFAITVIDKDEALETIRFFGEMEAAYQRATVIEADVSRWSHRDTEGG